MSQLAPNPKFTVYTTDSDGYTVPLAGGKVWTYTAGTSTPKATYTSYTLSAQNTNPVILDTDGQADIWLDGSYKFVITDAADVQLSSVDNIHDLTSNQTFSGMTLAGSLTITSTAVTWSGNPAHSGNHTFVNNVVIKGNTTLGDANTDALTVLPNAVTWTNNPTHSGNHTWSGTQTFSVIPAGKISGGTYTPTLTNGTNVAASTSRVCYYTRIGDVVQVSGVLSVDPTAAAATQTTLTISLPVASDLTSFEQLAGVGSECSFTATGNTAARIYGDTAANKATMEFNAGDASNKDWAFTFSYRVL